MALITIPVAAMHTSKDKTVKVLFTCNLFHFMDKIFFSILSKLNKSRLICGIIFCLFNLQILIAVTPVHA